MRKVLAIVCLLVAFTFIVSAMASAQFVQKDWRVFMKADDNSGSNGMAAITVGVQSGMKDGFGVDGTATDAQDGPITFTSTNSTRGVMAVYNNTGYGKDVKSNRVPLDAAYNNGVSINGTTKFGDQYYEPNRKIWDLRVFSYQDVNGGTATGVIRLTISTVSGTVLPVSTLPEVAPGIKQGTAAPAKYELRMCDNKGISGAPSNGTIWSVPIPTAHSATPYFTVTVPMLSISAKNAATAISEGYWMQFYQTPEPSSLMALGAGLMGLGGFFTRRRKA